jgi:hypothetical protein
MGLLTAIRIRTIVIERKIIAWLFVLSKIYLTTLGVTQTVLMSQEERSIF